MPHTIPPAAVAIAPLKPLGLSSQPEPVSVRAKGAGEMRLAHRYPLRDLIYTADPSGRGMLTFEMGSGVLMLSGSDADQISAETYLLHLDVMQIRSMANVRGDCTLTLSPDRHIYRAVTCRGVVPADDERFNLSWRGAERPAAPLR